MSKVVLDGSIYKTRDDFHKDVKDKFEFPEYYGNNLDALWDLLNERSGLDVEIINYSKLEDNLGDYGSSIIRLFEELKENDNYHVSFFNKPNIYTLKPINGIEPKVHASAYIAEGARVMGNVELGENVSVWYNAVIRGDLKNPIKIGKNSNVQDNAVIHLSEKSIVEIGENVTIGHAAIIHGAKIEDNVLIGMGAIVLDGAHIKSNSIIGAGALVTGGKIVEEGSMMLGSPAKFVRECSEDEIRSITDNALEYVENIKKHK